MSPATPDPHDELLRAALHAEADGVAASSDLLDRIHDATEAAPTGWIRRTPWLLAAAAAVIIVGLGAAIALRDEDQRLDAVDDPVTSTTLEPALDGLPDLLSGLFACDDSIAGVVYVAADASDDDVAAIVERLGADGRQPAVSVDPVAVRDSLLDRYGNDPAALRVIETNAIPSAILFSPRDPEEDIDVRSQVADLPGVEFITSTDCRNGPADRPTLVALVREDGWLVTVDLTTGDQRELHVVGDPTASTDVEQGGPYYIDGVDLSPDGQWVYFSTCCEPASGNTYRIPIRGGEPELIAVGAYPRVSPDGRFLATGAADHLIVTDLQGAQATADLQLACCISRLAWSPDGTQLVFTESTGAPGAIPQVRLYGWDGADLTEQDMGKPDNPGWFASWTPDGTSNISSGGPIEDDRSLSQDVSYEWLLWVDEAGVVREQAGMESGDRTPIAGLPEALAADW